MWSKLAITSFFLAIGLFLYNMFDVYLGWGSANAFSQSPKSLIDFFGPANFEWIESIPSLWTQTFVGYIIQVPFFAVLIYISVFSLLIYFILPERKRNNSVSFKPGKPQL
jgi:hypothetical protein